MVARTTVQGQEQALASATIATARCPHLPRIEGLFTEAEGGYIMAKELMGLALLTVSSGVGSLASRRGLRALVTRFDKRARVGVAARGQRRKIGTAGGLPLGDLAKASLTAHF